MNLLINYWPEYYKAINYLLNHIPIKQFNWKILFKITNNTKPDFNHIYIYRTKIYTLKNKVFYKDQLEFYIYIGFLINYDSHIIYHIWLLSSKCIIYIRDVTFIKDKFYKSDKLDLRFMKNIEEIIKYFEILSSRSVPEQKKSDFNKKKLSYIYN